MPHEAIAVKAHTLKALQKSYESFACRSILQERLKLQNELLKRDLQAIDVQVLDRNSETGHSDHRTELNDFEAVDDAQDKTEKFKGKPKRFVRQSTISASAFNVASQDEGLGQGFGEGLAPREVKPSDVKPSDVTPKVAQIQTTRKRKTTPPGSSHGRL
jgi:hypothetical protein